jgi:hypothetical protein
LLRLSHRLGRFNFCKLSPSFILAKSTSFIMFGLFVNIQQAKKEMNGVAASFRLAATSQKERVNEIKMRCLTHILF